MLQIYWGNISVLQVSHCLGQLALKRSQKLATGGRWGIEWTVVANENDAGGERVRTDSAATSPAFRTNRPSAANDEACGDYGAKEGLPAGASCSISADPLGLFEGIVDGDWKGRMRQLGEPTHRLGHTGEEERTRLPPCRCDGSRKQPVLRPWALRG